jgi:hypothetical protein
MSASGSSRHKSMSAPMSAIGGGLPQADVVGGPNAGFSRQGKIRKANDWTKRIDLGIDAKMVRTALVGEVSHDRGDLDCTVDKHQYALARHETQRHVRFRAAIEG